MTADRITLTQKSIYKSILNLPETDLPRFSLITGVNGSGKSHLLEAIHQGHVIADVAPKWQSDVRIETWATLVPNSVGATNFTQVHQNRDWFISQLRSRKAQRQKELLDLLHANQLGGEFAFDPWSALTVLPERLGNRNPQLVTDLLSFEKELQNHVRSQLGNDEPKGALFRELVESGATFHALGSRDFDKRPFRQYGANLFQQSFGELFFAYFDRMRANAYARLAASEGESPSVPPLSADEFVQKHGRPPWDFVNETLRQAKLDFEIDHPTDLLATEYLPSLTKRSTDAKVDFGSLSSGEKILMSFAFCLYNSTDTRQQARRPKLLLFDEVDASLHPSMSRVLVDIIKTVLVEKEGIPVIMVTHSPSTVAVSPDDSIFLLKPVTNRLEPETKRRAVATLTAEIPTMSIDFSGRRQVFVESDFDADRYAKLYQICAPSIASERSLSFIGVGQAPQAPTGAAQVRGIVKALEEEGNTSVLGLVDWDLRNGPDRRTHVLGLGERYAIENFLLDPLLLAVLLVSEGELDAAWTGETFVSLPIADVVRQQAAVNAVEGRVRTHLSGTYDQELIRVAYQNGRTMLIDRGYLLRNGHELEEAVLTAFPKLQRYSGTGKLMLRVIDLVLRSHPLLIPAPIFDALKALCEQDLN